MEENLILDLVKKCGVSNCALIEQSDIVYDISFREICEKNNCGRYNRCYACPPAIGDVYEQMEKVKLYKHGVLFNVVHELEDSYDVEGMADGKKAFTRCAMAITDEMDILGEDYLQLGVGGCGICERCAKEDGEPCRNPKYLKAAIEGCGMFVSETAKNAGLKYINGNNTVTYFGLVLFN